MTNVAAQCYKATLAVTSGLSAPFNNLAVIYKQQVDLHTNASFEVSLEDTVANSIYMFYLHCRAIM